MRAACPHALTDLWPNKLEIAHGLFLCFLFGLGSLRGPSLALCIGNALARIRAQHTLSAWLRCHCLGVVHCQLGGNFAGAGQKGTYLCQSCNFCIELGENGFNNHTLSITQLHLPAQLSWLVIQLIRERFPNFNWPCRWFHPCMPFATHRMPASSAPAPR